MTDPVHIVLGADDRFAMPLAVAASSAVRHLGPGRSAVVHVLDAGLTARNRARVERAVATATAAARVRWIVPDAERLRTLPAPEGTALNWTAYLRLLAPSLLPADLHRVIYLDADVVVCDDLGPLWDLPAGDAPAFGVQDYWIPTVSSEGGLGSAAEAVGLDPDTPYCNSGVLVLNVDVWRRERIAEQAFDYLARFRDQIALADQDAINAVVGARWHLLEPRWNVTLSSLSGYGLRNGLAPAEAAEAQDRLRASPGILHYTSRTKPWHFGRDADGLAHLYFHTRERDAFWRALRASRWHSPLRHSAWTAARRAWLTAAYKLPRRLGLRT